MANMTNKITRRSFGALALGSFGALALAACGSSNTSGS
ncbi:MAG: iron-siderophore ABC transporter substrate-binding protein, partial [Rothia mucilaginosa]|nr:iron-siderophore ABC transporter substrate-binding protein [Rothia mucilaginosa]